MNKYNCIIIIGPTASGKTALSIKLAKQLNGEIINADSSQMFKKLKIGTAKISKEEMQNVKHHLISFLNPDEDFSVSDFKDRAIKIINKLIKEKKVPIIVGGTGFYIDSLINNFNYGGLTKNSEIREKYVNLAKQYGKKYVFEILKKVDEKSAAVLHFNDLKRVIRALEIYETTGKTKAELSTMQNTMQGNLKPLIVGVNLERNILYDRINLRTDMMFNKGLVNEVKKLYNSGYSKNLQSIKSIGYKELYDYFDGQLTLEEAKQLIKKNTRNYAKRQLTWFNRYNNAVWFDVLNYSEDEIINKILTIFNDK